MADIRYSTGLEDKCTCTPSTVTQVINGNTFIITAKTGYMFSEPYTQDGDIITSPRLRFRNDNADTIFSTDTEFFNFTQSADNKTITFICKKDLTIGTIATYMCREDATHPVETEDLPVLTLSKNLVGCTISPNVESVEIDGTSKVFTITPDTVTDGKKGFKVAPKITINGVDHDFNLVNNVYTLDFNALGIDANVSGTINATALLYKNVTINADNMTFSPTPTKIFDDDILAITATANNGYVFRVAPYIHFHNRSQHQETFTKVTEYQYTLSLTVDDNELNLPNNNIELTGVAVGETPIIRKYGTIQVYKPSTADMNSLSTARFQQNGTVDGVTYADIDLGQYITQFKRVFVNVDATTNADIYLGRHNTQINAPVVNDDIVTVDCGNVTLTGENQNELDTKIYKIFLVLTCYGITPLDSVYMNKTINIKYQCNIITGYADIIISHVVENVLLPIQKLRCKIAQDLPYIINVEQLKNNVDDDGYNEPPKIILQKQNIFTGNGYDTNKQNTINNETGYFIIDRFVNHKINATENELNEIESLLQSGVTI